MPEPGEQFQVPVDIAGERFGHLLFHFAELLLQFVERFVLLVHGHELLVGALPFEVFAVGVVDFFRGVYQFREPFRAPQAHYPGERVAEDVGPVTVLDKLAEPAFGHFVAEDPVGKQRMLFAVEPGDRLGRRVAAESLAVFVGKGPEERSTFGGSPPQACL